MNTDSDHPSGAHRKCRDALLLIAVSLPFLTACTSVPQESKAGSDQTRFEQQQKGYPDRVSSQQEAEYAERERLAERLKQR